MMRQGALFIVLMVALMSRPSQSATKQDYYDVYDYLFGGSFYKKQLRPAENETSTMDVYLIFSLLSINDVDEKQQTLVTSAQLFMNWDDDYLSWDSASYGDISLIQVPQANIYLPDVVVDNSVTAQKQLGYDSLPVRILDNGTILWEPTILISTSCDIDITYFPFDSQTCQIVFATAVSTYSEIDISIDTSHPVSLDDYSENGQWDLIETSSTDLGNEGWKSKIGFNLAIKRRRTFYIMNIILPVFFLSMTSSLVFALPADEGEKMGTGITVLLAFAVYLTILSDLVPNTSLQVSILGLYLTILLGFSAVSLVVCAFILRIHFREESKPVGRKMTRATHFINRSLLRRTKNKPENIKNQVTPIVSDDVELDDKKHGQDSQAKPRLSFAMPMEPEEDPLTWKDVAFTLDLFCFILFTLLTILSTFVCLFALGVGGAVNTASV